MRPHIVGTFTITSVRPVPYSTCGPIDLVENSAKQNDGNDELGDTRINQQQVKESKTK
jgi:hypothetical protein